MDQNTKEAIGEYYKLKHIYDEKRHRAKRKVLHDNTLDNKTKRVALSSLKSVCVNCGKSGGTLFTETKDTLRAVCNATPQCELNMNIYRGSYKPFFPLYNKLNNQSETIRTNIVKTKLDLLFGYSTEESALSQFEEFRTDFNALEEDINELHMMLVTIIHNNRNKPDIMEATNNMTIIKNRIALLLREYKDSVGGSQILSNIVKEYIDELLPEAKRLREKKYAINEIEQDDVYYFLRQEPYLYTETEVQMTDE